MRQLKITFLLTVLICMIGAKTFAHDIAVKNSDGVNIYYLWNEDKTELKVSYLGQSFNGLDIGPNSYSGNVVIPESVKYNNKSYKVTSIGNRAFSMCSALISVTIPNSVTCIDAAAFYDSSNLISVTFPNSLTEIGENAFRGCSSLPSVNLSAGMISIGESAFEDCTNLTTISIPSSVTTIGADAFKNTEWFNNQSDGIIYINKIAYKYKGVVPENTEVKIKEGTKRIASRAFFDCESLTSITIPSSVIDMGRSAFAYCYNLTSVSIQNGIKTIDGDAFSFCENLATITIPNSVTTIGESAFWYCKSLTSITIPKGLTSIGECAFSGCSSLTSLIVEEGNTIYDSRNDCNAIIETASNTLIAASANTIIPNGVTSIAKRAFQGCVRYLSPLTIPYGVKTIGNEAFRDCAFTSVDIPNSVTTIGDRAFENCQCIGSITIPNSVTSIGEYAFEECYCMTSILIGKGVVSIGEAALSAGMLGDDRNKFKDVYCYAEQVPDFHNYYSSYEGVTFHVPAASLEAYKTAYGWNKIANIVPLEYLEPLVGAKTTTFGEEDDAISEETDLTDSVVDNIYYSMDQENGDGYDAESQALVLNSTNTEEQMSTVVEGKPGEDAVHDNYVGIIFELSSSSGMITIDLQTLGSNVLNIQVGKNKPKEFTQTDRGTITLRFNVGKPTYVYLYASSDKDHIASTRSAAENSVRLYGYKVDIDWSQLGDANDDWFINEEDIEEVSDHIMGKPSDRFCSSGDANGDGKIDAADIVTIANILK